MFKLLYLLSGASGLLLVLLVRRFFEVEFSELSTLALITLIANAGTGAMAWLFDGEDGESWIFPIAIGYGVGLVAGVLLFFF